MGLLCVCNHVTSRAEGIWNSRAKMLRVVPPERLRWSKESKGANRTSNKENATSVRSSAQDSELQKVILLACLKVKHHGEAAR